MSIFLSKELIEPESLSKTFVSSLSTSDFNQQKVFDFNQQKIFDSDQSREQIFFLTNVFISINSKSTSDAKVIKKKLFVEQKKVIERGRIEINIEKEHIEIEQNNDISKEEKKKSKKKKKLSLKNLKSKKRKKLKIKTIRRLLSFKKRKSIKMKHEKEKF